MAAMMAAAIAALMTTTVEQSVTRSSSKAATASSSSSTPDQNIGCNVDSNNGAEVAALMTTACSSSSGILYSDDYVESFCLREYLSCGVVEKVIFSTSSHSLTTQLPDYAALNCFLLS